MVSLIINALIRLSSLVSVNGQPKRRRTDFEPKTSCYTLTFRLLGRQCQADVIAQWTSGCQRRIELTTQTLKF